MAELSSEAAGLAARLAAAGDPGGADGAVLAALGRLGFEDPRAAWRRLGDCRRAIDGVAVDATLAKLLPALAALPAPDAALLRFARLVAALPADAAFWAGAVRTLRLLALTPGLAELVLARPELAAGIAGGTPPPGECETLQASLARTLDGAPDPAAACRRWLNEGRLSLGAAILDGRLDAADTGPAYTRLAEAAIAALLALVERRFEAEHGLVPEARFAVFALGKLGGREMSAGSDLDLVLVYDAADPHRPSTGPRPLAAAVYYRRLCNALLAALSERRGVEAFYEIDVRLSPWARKAAAAVSYESFRRYYGGEAWTWELMALTRGRAVAGEAALMAELEGAARAVLCRPRAPAPLAAEVDAMRRRIARHHVPEPPFDAKRRPGGQVDIEFTAQSLMLREAGARPEVLAVGTADALRRLARVGALEAAAAEELIAALRLWARLTCLARLTAGATADEMQWRALIAELAGLAPAALQRQVDEASRRVRALYDRLVAGPAAG